MTDQQRYASGLLSALEFAADMHRDQRRKGKEASPYINHPIQVAEILANVAGESDLALLMAAVLHDTIEDTVATREDLLERFGAEVTGLVAEVTDDKNLKKPERKRLQIEHGPHLSERARMIKIADKICNVRDIAAKPPGHWDDQRRLEYFDWAEKVVAACSGVSPALEAAFADALQAGRAAVPGG